MYVHVHVYYQWQSVWEDPEHFDIFGFFLTI